MSIGRRRCLDTIRGSRSIGPTRYLGTIPGSRSIAPRGYLGTIPGYRFPPPSTGTDESYEGRKSSSHDSPTLENSGTTIDLDLDNTYTNSRVETQLRSTSVAIPTGTDPKTNSTVECDLNLSDLSCFPCDSLNYTTVAI